MEVALFIVGQVLTAAAIWGGIRSDIRHLHESTREAKEEAAAAHKRIDALLFRRGEP